MSYSTGRTGWNRRGGSDRERILFEARRIHNEYVSALTALSEKMGKVAFEKWVDDNTYDGELKSSVAKKAREALEQLQAGEGPYDNSNMENQPCHKTGEPK